MADRMHPLSIESLLGWAFDELARRGSVFGIPRELFLRSSFDDPFGVEFLQTRLQTPLGVAAGPHTQLAQNIASAYLCGARFIELKTIQTLDQIEVTKPCIDMEDVGYNCEWSQELGIEESLAEYAKAWVLIRALGAALGLDGEPGPGFLFNMSVGYDLAGIRRDNVQRFLDAMDRAGEPVRRLLLRAARLRPELADLEPPEALSRSVTLSTMHGCPPSEIERIGRYLIEERGLHTAIKLNPTLLGPGRLREILHGELGFDDIEVPDEAFEHDPGFADAVAIIRSLQSAARRAGVFFWVKLTNTLETRNLRRVLPESEPVHYMSGRALHPLTVQLAADLSAEFEGHLPLSLSGGLDAFNVEALIAAGIWPLTGCSDFLRPGGYGRLPQYLERLAEAMRSAGAASPAGFVGRIALADGSRLARLLVLLRARLRPLVGPGRLAELLAKLAEIGRSPAAPGPALRERLVGAGLAAGLAGQPATAVADEFLSCAAQLNLETAARQARRSERYRRPRRPADYKTSRSLGMFDCIAAPCQEGCPANQNIPDYLYLAARGRFDEALEVVLRTNPLPTITGTVCDHPCMNKCVRSHYDRPLAIREIKRFLTERAGDRRLPTPAADRGRSVAVVGAGPAGLAAAVYLTLEGFRVTVFDARSGPGGVPEQMIPAYRLPDASLAADLQPIAELGVDFRFSVRVGQDVSLERLRREHDYVFIGTGAQRGLRLGLEGEAALGVFDCLDFLSQARQECALDLGRRVLVIGGGNSAIDAARTAWRLVGQDGQVTLVYRRSQAQMPADDEELEALRAEGIGIRPLTAPGRIVVEDDRVAGLECVEMELGPPDDSGRPRPVPIADSRVLLPADSVVVAVGQKPEGDWLARAGLALTGRGTLQVDEATFETSLPGVFAGGDVVRGGGSIIQAAADARRAVGEILRRENLEPQAEPPLVKSASPQEYLVRKARRVYPEPIPLLPVEQRRGFGQVGLSLSEEQARREAGRCLDCDEFCGLCVTVCPNRANLYYRSQPLTASWSELRVEDGRLVPGARHTWQVGQTSQIVNLADLCNECGNCQTFCPTQGAPFRDKPRLCFGSQSFAAEQQAYRFWPRTDGWTLEYKQPGALHRLTSAAGRLRYRSPGLLAELDGADLEPLAMRPGPEADAGQGVDLRLCFSMLVLGRGLAGDAAFLPVSSER